MARLAEAGQLTVAGLCDVQPIEDAGDVPVFKDHRTMLDVVRPDVVIVSTPPHTHLQIALDAVGAGADLLLEKPPVASLKEHRLLLDALGRHGRVCQVGFQALGSAALLGLIRAVPDSPTGGVAAHGAWWRPDSYWQRSRWAGRRRLDGRDVVDGALANPFAHALMQSLAVAEALTGWPHGPVTVELERYRTCDIEVDDTTCLRMTDAQGTTVFIAVTLASVQLGAPTILVDGAALRYTTDELMLPGDVAWQEVPGRVALLDDLLQHRSTGSPLIAPLERVRFFTAVLEVLLAAPTPALVPDKHLVRHPDGDGQAIADIDRTVRAAAAGRALFSDLCVPWAVAPHRMVLSPTVF
jgi:predicted dehydrogenase